MIKYVLVDLDGTITDSYEGVTRSIEHALNYYNIPVGDRSSLRKYIGPPITWSFKDAGVPEDLVAPAIEKYRERYNSVGLYEAEVYEGVPEMLKTLRENGKKLYLATSKPIGFAEKVMKYFKADTLMDGLYGAATDHSRNEKWQVIDYILECEHITDKSEVLMLGDTRFDVEGANKCGIKTMGVLWGFGNRESLEKEGASYIAETPEEAARMILNL